MSIKKRNVVVVSGSNDEQTVCYIMTKTFRIKNNYGLNQSIQYAKEHNCPFRILVVEPYETNQRNLDFFYENTSDLKDRLKDFTKDVQWLKRDHAINHHLNDIHTVFIDKSYLKFDIDLLKKIKSFAYDQDMILIEVESNVFVPVLQASDKEEYAARTIRPKINRLLDQYDEQVLTGYPSTKAEAAAEKKLNHFIDDGLDHYHNHNDPSKPYTSHLSPYLKFGFISPVTIYHQTKAMESDNLDDFLEEVIVRRELAYNFVYYNQSYDQFDQMTEDWAYKTMEKHLDDAREYLYSKEDYLHFNTHDPYFNAAMIEMVKLGRMHSYMRMYWAKKIIEWSTSYKEAFQTALSLNNHYFYDGLTPNGYTGVAWCFGKHDRAWFEREIFGKLRYMNANGLKRKFDIEDYVKQMNEIKGEE
ncbi:MAG TPA: deoxyribodipyrimidine photo-lyase [Candidatus Izemoplasmatales bacterium]|nr:deoxyribodipyrimidine photo-lyase [Candidatus Izemoplasmatales bacterium]